MGYHTFHVSFGRDGNSHLSELYKIAKKYGFQIEKDGNWIAKIWKPNDYNHSFTCTKELVGFNHWWIGGESGMEKKAKAMAWDIEQYLKNHKIAIEHIDLIYLSGTISTTNR